MVGLVDFLEPRIAFWHSPTTWPDDTKEHIFAARAILQLGRLRFPSTWTDRAPTTSLIWELPPYLSLDTPQHQMRQGAYLLRTIEGTYRDRTGPIGLAGLGSPVPQRSSLPVPTDQEWEIASQWSTIKAKESWALFEPFAFTAAGLAEACRLEGVQTATMRKEGGDLTPKPWHFWNAKPAWLRFETCSVNEDSPFLSTAGVPATSWIFLERDSFETYKNSFDPVKRDCGPSLPSTASGELLKEVARTPRKRGAPDRYPWTEMASHMRGMWNSGQIDDNTPTLAIARLLADQFAERWETLPDLKTIEKKVGEWRLLLLDNST